MDLTVKYRHIFRKDSLLNPIAGQYKVPRTARLKPIEYKNSVKLLRYSAEYEF